MSDVKQPLHPATQVIHAGQRPEPTTGAVLPPIFTAATYVQKSPGEHQGFEYTRSHNPTRYALERMVAGLEGSPVKEDEDPSCGGFAFASGLAATATVLELIDQGSRVVAMDDLYGGTRRQFSQVRERTQGLQLDYVDMTDLDLFRRSMTADTQLVWVETPTNPLMKVVDLVGLAKIAREINPETLLVCDNTFASPMSQNPLALDFDLVMHSTTKYLNGHSDVVGGLVVVNRPELAARMRFLQNALGAVMGPFDAYQTLRGIKTLALRIERHSENGQRVAEFLEAHDGVEQVYYPGLPSHPQYELAKGQMRFLGGMVSLRVSGTLDNARRFCESLRVFQLAESLGAVESLANHPAIMTHASVPKETRDALGITDTLVRLSVGVENIDDLLADLEQSLAAAV